MSRYDKTAEYRAIDHFERLGATLVTHFGDRHHKSGDFIVDYKGLKIRCDHKSCHQDLDFMRVQKNWLIKIIKENGDYHAIPIITISLLGRRDRWCLVDKNYIKGKPEGIQIFSEDWSWKIPVSSLQDVPVILLDASDYLMKIDVMLRMIDNGGIALPAANPSL